MNYALVYALIYALNYAVSSVQCSAMFCHLIESATLLHPLFWATSLVILLLLQDDDDDDDDDDDEDDDDDDTIWNLAVWNMMIRGYDD